MNYIFYSFFSPPNRILQARSAVVKVVATFKGHILVLISLCSLAGYELLTILFLKFSSIGFWVMVCSPGSIFGCLPTYAFSSHNAILFHGSDHLLCAEKSLIYISRLSCFCKIQFQPIYQSSYYLLGISQRYLKLIVSITHLLCPIKLLPLSCSVSWGSDEKKSQSFQTKVYFSLLMVRKYSRPAFKSLVKISLVKLHVYFQGLFSCQQESFCRPWVPVLA